METTGRPTAAAHAQAQSDEASTASAAVVALTRCLAAAAVPVLANEAPSTPRAAKLEREALMGAVRRTAVALNEHLSALPGTHVRDTCMAVLATLTADGYSCAAERALLGTTQPATTAGHAPRASSRGSAVSASAPAAGGSEGAGDAPAVLPQLLRLLPPASLSIWELRKVLAQLVTLKHTPSPAWCAAAMQAASACLHGHGLNGASPLPGMQAEGAQPRQQAPAGATAVACMEVLLSDLGAPVLHPAVLQALEQVVGLRASMPGWTSGQKLMFPVMDGVA